MILGVGKQRSEIKPYSVFNMLASMAGWISISFGVVSLLLCVLCAILSRLYDDPRGPGPMGDVPYSFLSFACGFLSVISFFVGVFFLAITQWTEKKTAVPTASPEKESTRTMGLKKCPYCGGKYAGNLSECPVDHSELESE